MAEPVKRPKSWEKAVMAAYVISLGGTQKEASVAAGAGENTVHNWTKSEWWGEALAEAERRWIGDVKVKAKQALLRVLDSDDATTVRWATERLIKALEPPTQRIQVLRDASDEEFEAEARRRLAAQDKAEQERREALLQ